jgi:hypothetical protein
MTLLRKRMTEDMRVRNLARTTQTAHLQDALADPGAPRRR